MDFSVRGIVMTPEADCAEWARSFIKGKISECLRKEYGPYHPSAEFSVDVCQGFDEESPVECRLTLRFGKKILSTAGIGKDLHSSLEDAIDHVLSRLKSREVKFQFETVSNIPGNPEGMSSHFHRRRFAS